MNEVDKIYNDLNNHLDDGEWLSRVIVELSGLLYTHNTKMAQAELTEKKVIVDLMSNTKEDEKKMSVTEAEKRAVVQTGNIYGIYKAQAEAIIETIQSIKVRIRVLENERQMANN